MYLMGNCSRFTVQVDLVVNCVGTQSCSGRRKRCTQPKRRQRTGVGHRSAKLGAGWGVQDGSSCTSIENGPRKILSRLSKQPTVRGRRVAFAGCKGLSTEHAGVSRGRETSFDAVVVPARARMEDVKASILPAWPFPNGGLSRQAVGCEA